MSADQTCIVTVLGPDRPGLVDGLSAWVRDVDGGWLNSHLTQVGDQFAGILQVAIPRERIEDFESQIHDVSRKLGLEIHLKPVGATVQKGSRFAMTCLGQDRPGIVKALTDIFLAVGANIETLETSTQDAPMSGEILFEARFDVLLPASVDLHTLEERLAGIGEEMMLDVRVQNELSSSSS